MSDELIFLARHTVPPAYTIENLGMLPEGRISHALAINSRGDVAGESDGENGMRAVLWADSDVIDLGTLGGFKSTAVALNATRQVVGMAEREPGKPAVAFLWQDGRMIDLEAYAGINATVTDINNESQIVGDLYFSVPSAPGVSEGVGAAFRLHLGTLTRLTDTLKPPSTARAINSMGAVAGYFTLEAEHVGEVVVWSEGKMTLLGEGVAAAISDRDNAVAGYYSSSAQHVRACVWTGDVRLDLPARIDIKSSQANGINSRGDVVGQMTDGDWFRGNIRPFLWQRDHVIDLNDVIDSDSGWILRDATAINDAGQIVGWGFFNHRHTAFRLTPNSAA